MEIETVQMEIKVVDMEIFLLGQEKDSILFSRILIPKGE